MAKIIIDLVLVLAICMQEEVAVLNSDAAALAVYEVAENRRRDSRFSDNLHTVLLEGFYGYRPLDGWEIEPRYVRLAARALSGEHEWKHGALYMLSTYDCWNLGVSTGGAMRSYWRGIYGVHLFETWPVRN